MYLTVCPPHGPGHDGSVRVPNLVSAPDGFFAFTQSGHVVSEVFEFGARVFSTPGCV